MDSGSRYSTTDSATKNYNSTERFGIEIKLNNSVSDTGHTVEINSKSRSTPHTQTSNQNVEEELILKLQDLNSGFRNKHEQHCWKQDRCRYSIKHTE